MANNRIFYACQAVAVGAMGAEDFTPIHGVQSVGINTTFNLEQAFELGQIQIYENIEGVPDVEVTLEKVLDGYPLIYHLATPSATDSALVNRAVQRADVVLGIYTEDKNAVSGQAPVEVYMSGMYINAISYTLPVDGNSTESVTLVGNHKEWSISGSRFDAAIAAALTNDDGSDEPLALTQASGGIQRRENVLIDQSNLPIISGYDHVQTITISTDLGREDLFELGRKTPYYRAPNYPVEVTCEIEVITVSGDFINAYEEGLASYVGTRDEGNNTPERTIVVYLQDGTMFDLGTKNRLSSVNYGGGDAGGGNSTVSYSYTTFNDLTVTHPQDPAGL
jgi:hypothetical protein